MLAYWEADGTFQASVEQRDRGRGRRQRVRLLRRPAVRQRAAALRPPAHRLRQGHRPALPDDARQAGRAAVRLGHPRAARRARGDAAQLGIKTTDEILELGIEKFNEACRASVMKYTGEWRDYVTRQARWVDFDNDYRTMNPDYMESVIWAFKQLYDKGLVYEGFRVLPYCWNDETPLSNHELRMDDDVYQNRQDPAVTVGVRLRRRPRASWPLVWTTTPVDAADQPRGDGRRRHRLRRRRVRRHRHHRALRRSARPGWRRTPASSATSPTVVAAAHGQRPASAAATRRRSPTTPATRTPSGVVEAEFVTTTDGTGLVHTAGAFGEDDKVVTDREGIEPVMPVGKDGRFTFPVTEYEGMQVFDANLPIIDHLRAATRGEAGRLGHARARCCCAARPTTTPTRTAGAAASP